MRIVEWFLNLWKILKKEEDEDKVPIMSEEEYWNNKWPKTEGIYKARNRNKYDVRSFIWSDDVVLKDIIKKNNLMGENDDETAYKCMRFVQKRIKYKPDKGEDWKYPLDTYYDGYGDCEDSSFLLLSLINNCGVPLYKAKVCCGWVLNPRTKKYDIGHAYVIYLREDKEWVSLDTTYYPTTTKINLRQKHKNDKKYGRIWFTFNSKFVWSQHSVKIDKNTLKRS